MTYNEEFNRMSIAEKAKFFKELESRCEVCYYHAVYCKDYSCEEGIQKYLESEAE